jgi:phenylacetate-CoA ligase
MHGLALIYVLRDEPAIENFKIVQESLDCCRVLIETQAPPDDMLLARIRDGVRKRLGAEVEVAIERVERIPPEASGKFRYVVSRVPVAQA